MNTNKLLIWCAGSTLIAVILGRLVASIYQTGAAPILITSLVYGSAVGGGLVLLALPLGVRYGRALLLGTVVSALVAAVAQHAWLYIDFRREWHEAQEKSPHVALFRQQAPWSPIEYFERELTPERAVLWSLDMALIVTAAAATVIGLQKLNRNTLAENSLHSPTSTPS